MDTGKRRLGIARQALVAAMWLALVGSAAFVTLALAWPDTLTRRMGARFLVDVGAFFAATFTFHAGLATLALAAVSVALRRWLLAASAVVIASVAAGPGLLSALTDRSSPGTSSEAIVLYSANLMFGRADPEKLLADIRGHDPEVLLFQEWTPTSQRRVAGQLRETYPYVHEHPRDDAFGQAVFSKRPFVEPCVHYSIGGRAPQLTIAVDAGGEVLRVTNIHLQPPVSRWHINRQREDAVALATLVETGASLPDLLPEMPLEVVPDVVIGDFNAVPGSSTMRRLRAAGLSDAHKAAGVGRGATWPQRGPLPIRAAPGIRIDHALIGPRWRAVRSLVGGDIGADHRAVIVTIEPAHRSGVAGRDKPLQK